MVGREGIEPSTPGLKGQSYGFLLGLVDSETSEIRLFQAIYVSS